jgi:hypothetical protein
MSEEIKFPRNLYTSPGKIKWGSKKQGSKTYDTVLVKDQKEFDAAVKAGYVDNFHDALFAEKKEEPVEFNIEKIEDYTKPQIMLFLDKAEAVYNPRDQKDILKTLLAEIVAE